jgi:hypothetical protein
MGFTPVTEAYENPQPCSTEGDLYLARELADGYSAATPNVSGP